MKFIDEVEITVASGKGGPGAVSFRRELKMARGGPDGGDGGKGGSVIFRADPQLNSLMDLRFKREYLAGDGEKGQGSCCTGADGADVVIKVPVGTVIKDTKDTILFDLDKPQDLIFLKGGRGGKGNYFFRTSVNQAPDRAQPGEPGESREVHLELKLLADVGLIGFPNAGKSTLISKISAARPKIADYPFTTLVPNLGVVRIDAEKSFVVADIPGLIAGAHQGVGLGIQFLRHIERTKVFVHLVDVSDFNTRDPWQDYVDINIELAGYDKGKSDEEGYRPLSKRPQVVVLTKIDAVEDSKIKEVVQLFKRNGVNVLTLSAVSGRGLKELLGQISKIVFAGTEELDL